jgi:lipopolysaccharide exporter
MNSSFFKNVLTLVSGNAIAMALPILCYPLLSRIFTPSDYALFGVYFSVFSFLEIGSAGRYDATVVLPPKKGDAANLVAGGLVFAFFYSLIILTLVFLFRDFVASSFHNSV